MRYISQYYFHACHSLKVLILFENRFKTISKVHSCVAIPVYDVPFCHKSDQCISVSFEIIVIWWSGGHWFDPHGVQKNSYLESNHEIFYMFILSLLLIWEVQLSVSGKRMYTNTKVQVSPVITRWSGCTNPDRDIGEARSKFGADWSDSINVYICMGHTYIHVWRDLWMKTMIFHVLFL